MEKRGMVKSVEGSRHVESSQNCNFSRVNGFHDIICEFEQSSLSGMKFAADCKGQKLGDMKTWGKRRTRARRSNILLIVFKFKIGRKFESSGFGRPGFFRSGEIVPILILKGKWLGWTRDLPNVKWGWRKCLHMISLVKLGCSQVVMIYLSLTRVVEKLQLGWQAWSPKVVRCCVADQNQKVRGCCVILERLTPWGQQSFDERKKQGNLPVVVIWKVRVVYREETSEEVTWWWTKGAWDFWKPRWCIQHWTLHVTWLSTCLRMIYWSSGIDSKNIIFLVPSHNIKNVWSVIQKFIEWWILTLDAVCAQLQIIKYLRFIPWTTKHCPMSVHLVLKCYPTAVHSWMQFNM